MRVSISTDNQRNGDESDGTTRTQRRDGDDKRRNSDE